MDNDFGKRSGQIPAFGDWDYANDLPITQYFECARQAGLIRFSNSSSGESNPYVANSDLYAVDLRKHSRNLAPPRKVSRVREKRGPHVKEQRKAGRVCDVTEPPRKQQHQYPHHVTTKNNANRSKQLQNDVVIANRLPVRPPKPVDEDLYKIPPELLHSSKRKKMPGFFSCLVPACAT
ncbi:hypothetical protein COLO4_20545 [Corchorus olitorius]|uniref:Pathogenic type III effector avirulence factor Avr cleavage site n=1 Tax=Corchorus olitorius TaxID=93759 RepID=A0A1R3IZ19_9ROSI|nr:hypothetical protein COLO4_20545 [Corchorus olitorius]